MKSKCFALCLILVLLLSACASAPAEVPAPAETEGALLSAFTAKDLDGNIVDEEILTGKKLTMINVWATYCGPCLMEMPELGALSEEMADKGVQVIGIVLDGTDMNYRELPDTLAEARAIAEETGVNYPSLIPCRDLAALCSVQAVPTTIFVDEQGRQVGEARVGARDLNGWRAVVEELLEAVS